MEEGESEGGFDRYLPLESIFNHLNGHDSQAALPIHPLEGPLVYPQAGLRLEQGQYARILQALKDGLSTISVRPEYLNSLLALLEGWTSALPSSTAQAERADISLFDHSKIAAAAAACISEYLDEAGRTDLKAELLEHQGAFRRENAFLLFTADLSGIQSFLYAVTTEKALKSLRSRSFYLELLMEHIIDLLLDGCGLCRVNLLYSGGGHCYLLLPNTQAVRRALEQLLEQVKHYLIASFGIQLYLAAAWVPCSADDLINQPAEAAPYQGLYRRLSQALAEQKLHRYTAEDLSLLNQPPEAPAQRECKVCGRSDQLEEAGICSWCQRFADLSGPIQSMDVYLLRRSNTGPSIPLPGAGPGEQYYLYFVTEDQARKALATGGDVVRVYTKNKLYTGLRYATRLYVGDYHASNLMEELAQQAQGIRRVAICRADVDNLGACFVSGFERPGETPAQRSRYVTLSRTATLSRALSVFFRYHINGILEGGQGGAQQALPVSIVYSGGDDIFLVGAWDGVLEAARRIRDAFSRYTGGALSLSAGLTLQTQTYPIRQGALETEALEGEAKALEGKDGICLFAAEQGFAFHWDEFTRSVLGEKLACLCDFFQSQSPDAEQRGRAFLYRLLALLRRSDEAINMARFAYLLARMEPGRRAKPAQQEAYRAFSRSLYRWYREPEDRRQLITAIYLYVYQTRVRED